mmetsp:Transcript_18272/g.58145  ORF Transcript_18272/g.58145 Transcript_18272/m.58145 type:complete len:482 (-) Transcript_18272:1356-2801(-)
MRPMLSCTSQRESSIEYRAFGSPVVVAPTAPAATSWPAATPWVLPTAAKPPLALAPAAATAAAPAAPVGLELRIPATERRRRRFSSSAASRTWLWRSSSSRITSFLAASTPAHCFRRFSNSISPSRASCSHSAASLSTSFRCRACSSPHAAAVAALRPCRAQDAARRSRSDARSFSSSSSLILRASRAVCSAAVSACSCRSASSRRSFMRVRSTSMESSCLRFVSKVIPSWHFSALCLSRRSCSSRSIVATWARGSVCASSKAVWPTRRSSSHSSSALCARCRSAPASVRRRSRARRPSSASCINCLSRSSLARAAFARRLPASLRTAASIDTFSCSARFVVPSASLASWTFASSAVASACVFAACCPAERRKSLAAPWELRSSSSIASCLSVRAVLWACNCWSCLSHSSLASVKSRSTSALRLAASSSCARQRAHSRWSAARSAPLLSVVSCSLAASAALAANSCSSPCMRSAKASDSLR